MSTVQVDTINESTTNAGVTVDGVLIKDNAVNTDTITEKTSGSGVTIDSVLLKDGIAHSGLVKLASATASNSVDITFDNFVDNSVYASYLLYIENHTPQNNANGLYMKFRNSSSADITDSYHSAYYERKVGNGAGSDAEGKQTNTNFGDVWGSQTTTTANTLTGTAMLHMPDSGLGRFHIDGSLKNSSNTYMWIRRDIITSTVTGVKGIKLYQFSGNITSGEYTIFGVKK